MLPLQLPAAPRVLCLGAHCDDIDIGAGGTLLRLREEHPGAEVTWVIFSSSPERAAEARASAGRFLGEGAEVRTEAFRDGFLPYEGAAVKEAFERLKDLPNPDLILTHWGDDAHQDHRQVWELTRNTFRDHLILEYEVPKWDGDMGQPNLYVSLTRAQVERKIEYLADSYPTQSGKDWFDPDLFRGLMRLRGMEARAPEKHAEAFYARKLSLSF